MSEYMERDAQRHLKEMDERPEQEETETHPTHQQFLEHCERMRKKTDWLEVYREMFINKTENLL